ncbi:MAG: zinc ribbon domain-containing protein [Candidatus Hermodarchaeota archaeon]
MKTIVALSYFHRKIGPLVFYSYPKDMLERGLSLKIANIMDQQFSEGFFTHIIENLKSLNYYFEIHSDWARGNKEMLMVSTILNQRVSTEAEDKISALCTKFSKQLLSNEEIYTAFYINDINNFDEEDQENIRKNEALIKTLVENLYWVIIEDIREKTEEEELAILLNDKHIFMTLEKLSEGPILLENLREWFIEKFPEKNLNDIIEVLDERQFIFINQIGLVEKYVLLVKDVNLGAKGYIKKHISEIREDENGDFPFPYVFKPPKPPDDLALAGEPQAKEPIIMEDLEHFCKHCGAELPKGQSICHACGKKVK